MVSTKFDLLKLDGKNDFGLWRLKMRALLVHQGVVDVLAGETNLPATLSDKEKKDMEKAHSALILCLGDRVLREVSKENTAAGIWSKLESLYMTKSLANRLYLKKRLYTFQMTTGNLGNLLLIIIPAVCEESNSPFGDKLTCSANGQGLVSLSMAIGAVYIWSYVYNIIRAYGNLSSKDIAKSSTISIDCSGKTLDMFMENYTEALVQSRSSSFEDCEDPDDDYSEVHDHNIAHNDVQDENVTLLTRIKVHVDGFSDKINLKMWMTPSTIATIVGLLIGVISPVRKLMIGDNAPLRVIDSSASLLGEATVPAMTLIVGANLFNGLKKSGVGVWLVVGILVVRYVALPIVGIGIVKAAHRVGFVGSDSLYQFVLLIQYSLPPAMAIGTITQLFELGESECSVIMLWTYSAAAVALTLWTTLFMWLVSG